MRDYDPVIGGSPFLLYPIKTNQYILYLMYTLKKNTVKRSRKCNSCLWRDFRREVKSWIALSIDFLHWRGRNMLFLQVQVHTVRPTLIFIFSRLTTLFAEIPQRHDDLWKVPHVFYVEGIKSKKEALKENIDGKIMFSMGSTVFLTIWSFLAFPGHLELESIDDLTTDSKPRSYTYTKNPWRQGKCCYYKSTMLRAPAAFIQLTNIHSAADGVSCSCRSSLAVPVLFRSVSNRKKKKNPQE